MIGVFLNGLRVGKLHQDGEAYDRPRKTAKEGRPSVSHLCKGNALLEMSSMTD
jgi:hypothetical protein